VFSVKWELKFYLLFKNLNFQKLQFLGINTQIWHVICNKGNEGGTGRACSTHVRGGI